MGLVLGEDLVLASSAMSKANQQQLLVARACEDRHSIEEGERARARSSAARAVHAVETLAFKRLLQVLRRHFRLAAE